MSKNPLHADGYRFKDEGGRVVILRGVNVAGNSKIPPFVPFSDTTRLDPVKEWGMNVIRLVLIWEAIEPEPGKYNGEYIDAVEALANAAGERGIYVILDMHQDMFSRYLNGGCGDGAPSWAIDPSIPQDEPANDERCIDWVNGLNDKNVLRAFDSFYANVNGVRDHYISMWAHIARRFGDHPAVIGYDLMNEPIGDEVSQLAPLYEDAGAAIRDVDPDGILFIEPSILTSFGAIYSQLRHFPLAITPTLLTSTAHLCSFPISFQLLKLISLSLILIPRWKSLGEFRCSWENLECILKRLKSRNTSLTFIEDSIIVSMEEPSGTTALAGTPRGSMVGTGRTTQSLMTGVIYARILKSGHMLSVLLEYQRSLRSAIKGSAWSGKTGRS